MSPSAPGTAGALRSGTHRVPELLAVAGQGPRYLQGQLVSALGVRGIGRLREVQTVLSLGASEPDPVQPPQHVQHRAPGPQLDMTGGLPAREGTRSLTTSHTAPIPKFLPAWSASDPTFAHQTRPLSIGPSHQAGHLWTPPPWPKQPLPPGHSRQEDTQLPGRPSGSPPRVSEGQVTE